MARGPGRGTGARLRLSSDDIRAALWVPPALAGAATFVAAIVLLRVPAGDAGWLGQVAWPGDRTAASTTLQVIAGSVVTATTIAFSMVVVAFQLASQQFSPRLLRDFSRDRVIQGVVSMLFATFVFALTTLRGMNQQTPLPRLSVGVAFVLALGSMAALLGFLAHMTRMLRVDTMMVSVHEETRSAIDRFYDPYDRPPTRPSADTPGPDGGRLLTATRSGFVLSIDIPALVRAVADAGGFLRLGVRPGDHVTAGTPIGSWWEGADDQAADPGTIVQGSLKLGYERTRDQDAALGFRQLSDIAVKALSPGINDPGTAVHAVGFMADLLVRLCDRSLGPGVHHDDTGTARVVIPDRDLRYYLDIAGGLVRRFGRREPTVLIALLGMCRDVATAARDDEQRDEIRRQVRLVMEEMADDLVVEDADAVRDVACRVHQVLDGNLAHAYADRSGETRSM